MWAYIFVPYWNIFLKDDMSASDISVISNNLSEIYRIVSQKQLPDSPGGNKPGGSGTTPITISSTVDNNQPAKKPCCN